MWLLFLQFILLIFPTISSSLAFSLLSSICIFQSLAGHTEATMATVRRASPRTMRCSPCPISGAVLPPDQTRPLQSRNLQKKWTFSASMGGTSAARVLPPNLLLLQPQPLTSSGTCSEGRPSQPVGGRLPSPRHIKLPQTPPRPVHLLHHQVQHTTTYLCVYFFSK